MRKKIGLFGGTFDPVHIGHLRLALELKQQLNLDEMRLLPCHQPPHRAQPQATSAQRAEMLRVALQACTELQIDERELQRDKPSYTYDTLLELRAELGNEISLILCMGADAFTHLPTWHCWQKLITLAHIVVIARPGWNLPECGEAADLFASHQGQVSDLNDAAAGSIILVAPRLLPISATEIRTQIFSGESAQFLVPDAVGQYITEHNLYR